MLDFDDMELMQLQFCMKQTQKNMSMGGEIRRYNSIMEKIGTEMEKRKNETGAYTTEGILRKLDEQIERYQSS